MTQPSAASAGTEIRLDKWLWAARFYKTRKLAGEAIDGGHVHVDGQRAKPSRLVRIGQRIEITKDQLRWDITVQGLSIQRCPAREAALLYAEDPASHDRRQQEVARRREGQTQHEPSGRPTKRDRRMIHRFKRDAL